METAVPLGQYRLRLEYVASLEASADDKTALFKPWIDRCPDGWVVDMGTGPGGVAARLAAGNSRRPVLAVDSDPDMLEIATDLQRGADNVSFQRGEAQDHVDRDATAWILSSVLHELASQGGLAAVMRALQTAWLSLRPGGVLILRDFVRPRYGARRVLLEHDRVDIRPGRSFADLATAARHPMRFDGQQIGRDRVTYETDMAGAYEFLFRKDWGCTWENELWQLYGFWTFEQCRDLVQKVGFRVVCAGLKSNRWIMRNHIRDHVRVRDARNGQLLTPPVSQVFLVAEKVAGDHFHPLSDPPD